MKVLTLCLAMISAVLPVSNAQQTEGASRDPILRVKVRQVVVPVNVLDKAGQSVRGLKAADFRVYEDGIAQPVIALTWNGDPAADEPGSMPEATAFPHIPRSASAPGRPAQRRPRTYVICFDQLHATHEGFYRSRIALDKFLRKDIEGPSRIVLVNLGTGIQVVQTATTDLDLVRRTVAGRAFAMTSGGPERLDFTAAVNGMKETMEGYCRACLCGRVASDAAPGCKARQEQIRQDIDTKSGHFAAFGKAFMTGLKALVDEQGKLGGLTTFVLVSEGFNLHPGKDLYAVASAYLPERFAFQPPYDLQPALDEVIRSALVNNIVIETIDARGVYNPSFLPGGMQDASTAQMGRSAATNRGGALLAEMDSKWSSLAFENASALSQMADMTGGGFHHNGNDLSRAFRDAFSRGLENYLLTFQPSQPSEDGRFHSIRVEMSTKRPVIVRAKKGYWAATP